jgi:hypothetical protein
MEVGMLSSEESQQIGRIEAKVDILIDSDTRMGGRVTALEKFSNRVKGVLAFITFFGSIIGLVIVQGCAHWHHKEFADGELISSTVSTVIGTGETSYILQCEHGVEAYTTADTGISTNGKDLAADAVAAGVKAALPGIP